MANVFICGVTSYYYHHIIIITIINMLNVFYYFLAVWRQTAAEKIPDVQQASAISPPDDRS